MVLSPASVGVDSLQVIKILLGRIPLRPCDFLATVLASFQSSPKTVKHEDCNTKIVKHWNLDLNADQKDFGLWELE